MMTVLLVLAVLVGAVLLAASMRPGTFSVRRTATVGAPPEAVFEHINDFHRWGAWSPWERLDPAMQRTHSGAESGSGAIYEWSGNKKVGRGRMEILESRPSSLVRIKLDFFAPFESHNTTEFSLEPSAGGTNITWDMHGPATLMSKVMGLFVNMDKMVGKDFETGLSNLKSLVAK
jgi:carbon monoxide dehydrogenase subunit G